MKRWGTLFFFAGALLAAGVSCGGAVEPRTIERRIDGRKVTLKVYGPAIEAGAAEKYYNVVVRSHLKDNATLKKTARVTVQVEREESFISIKAFDQDNRIFLLARHREEDLDRRAAEQEEWGATYKRVTGDIVQ